MINIILLKKTFKKGDVIFKEDDDGTEAYLVRHGYVTISKQEDDQTIELATRGPGEIIGEMALMDDSPRSATLSAKTDVEVEIITRKDLKDMMEHIPEQMQLMVHQLLERLRDANELAVMNAAE